MFFWKRKPKPQTESIPLTQPVSRKWESAGGPVHSHPKLIQEIGEEAFKIPAEKWERLQNGFACLTGGGARIAVTHWGSSGSQGRGSASRSWRLSADEGEIASYSKNYDRESRWPTCYGYPEIECLYVHIGQEVGRLEALRDGPARAAAAAAKEEAGHREKEEKEKAERDRLQNILKRM